MPKRPKPKDPEPEESSPTAEFICTGCKRKAIGLRDEEPPGWAWRPIWLQGNRGARFELECHDCRDTTKPIWENDDRDCVPKEAE